jgi:hypothetical protein
MESAMAPAPAVITDTDITVPAADTVVAMVAAHMPAGMVVAVETAAVAAIRVIQHYGRAALLRRPKIMDCAATQPYRGQVGAFDQTAKAQRYQVFGSNSTNFNGTANDSSVCRAATWRKWMERVG